MKNKWIILNLLVFVALLVLNISCSLNKQTVSDSPNLEYEKQLQKYQKEMFDRFEMFNPSSLPTKAQLYEHYEKYKKKFIDIGLKSLRMIPILYSNRVNLHEISKYKEYGIDFYELDKNNFLQRHGWNFNTSALISPIIIEGTVVDTVTFDFEKERIQIYTTKVDKFIKGSDYFITPPEYVKIYHLEGFWSNGELLKLRGSPTYFCELNKSYLLILESTINEKNLNRYQQSNNYNDEVKSYLKEQCQPTSFRIMNRIETTFKNFELFKNSIQEIEEINDTSKFYSRDP